MVTLPGGARAPSLLVISAFLATAGPALAQGAGEGRVDLPDIVVTADRRAEPIARSGSAISVVTRDQIETFNSASVVDVLRNVPGLDISESGGPGATSSVRIRGANAGQTLVLIDGIRVNDPAGPAGDFDFATLLPTAIDRIEVLRGPQSSLYGSDAIGGVVNILTRTGEGPPRYEVRTEGGSYGTFSSSATGSGSIGPWSFAFSGGGQRDDGFSRYGYRIGQLTRRFGSFEADGFTRYGGYGKIGYDAGNGVRLELGLLSILTDTQYDAASSTLPSATVATGPRRIYPDTPSASTRLFTQIFGRATVEQGPLTHTLKVYANETARTNDDFSYRNGIAPANTSWLNSEFRGDRVGVEYQGDLNLGSFGTLTAGGKFENETATTFATTYLPVFVPRARQVDAGQDTKSLFVLYQLPIGERLILTAGGRHDEVGPVQFDTWRATAAYLIPETGTKLRASGGTGGKAPTLYELYAPIFGNTTLLPETSIGWDAGIDQTLLDGRAKLSATAFGNHFNNLINFDTTRNNGLGGYLNTARAATSGIELEGSLVVLPEVVRLTSAYTYLHAQDLATHLTLQRRPRHVGRVGIAWTPLPGLLIEPRVTFVSKRFSGNNETQPLPRYGRLDLYAEYRIDPTWKVFGRIENITDARYQEVLNYGTTGRAAYAGFSATW